MKIEFELTEEQLKNTLDGLNNALIAVRDEYRAAWMGVHYNDALAPIFEGKDPYEVQVISEIRLRAIKSLYETLLKYEDARK